jgi:prepilin-type N-terminal cleavage/methylation domain-containing protein
MKKGFTLVEIMIVVAIIALLAAIAIPNLLRARLNANEAAAKSTLKTIVAAATSYASAAGGQYPGDLNTLTSASPPYLDDTLDDSSGTPDKQGYYFDYNQGNSSYSFWVNAAPVSAGTTGNNYFYVDEGGVVCSDTSGAAGSHAASGSSCPGNFTAVE